MSAKIVIYFVMAKKKPDFLNLLLCPNLYGGFFYFIEHDHPSFRPLETALPPIGSDPSNHQKQNTIR